MASAFDPCNVGPLATTDRCMELYQIRYFLALADTLNFTRASERSFVSQPALTKAIQRLEENIGAAGVALSAGDLSDIDSAASQITVQGARYAEASQRMIDR